MGHTAASHWGATQMFCNHILVILNQTLNEKKKKKTTQKNIADDLIGETSSSTSADQIDPVRDGNMVTERRR